MIVMIFPITGYASDITEEYVVVCFDDGSYITEKIIENHTRSSGTQSGSKEKTYYGNDGVVEWVLVVSGTFTYSSSGASCTKAGSSVTIYDSKWYTISKSAAKSGNTATAYATMGEKLLGVKVDEVSTSVSLKCDANGNLSRINGKNPGCFRIRGCMRSID